MPDGPAMHIHNLVDRIGINWGDIAPGNRDGRGRGRGRRKQQEHHHRQAGNVAS